MFDINQIRNDFPILGRKVYDRPLVYLDNAATTQKPRPVVEAITEEYYNVNANVHRGVHYLSQQATDLHEGAREKVRQFINARATSEIIFTRGTTESLNLVASSFCDEFMREGDEVIVSVMEHHSNIVPWQLQAAKRGISIRVIPMTDEGELKMDEYEKFFDEFVKFFEKYDANDPSMYVQYATMMAQYAKTTEAIQSIDQDSLSTADQYYYVEVTARITAKLAQVQQKIDASES